MITVLGEERQVVGGGGDWVRRNGKPIKLLKGPGVEFRRFIKKLTCSYSPNVSVILSSS